MKGAALFQIFETIAIPEGENVDTPLFAVRIVPDYLSYFIGKDSVGQACFLVETKDELRLNPPPIRLESVDAQFELNCQITNSDGQVRWGWFTVIRCRSCEIETVRYFLSVCSAIMSHVGDAPSHIEVAEAVRRIASIFQDVRKPPRRSLNGLFSELFVISRSKSPARAVAAWRNDNNSRFDFSEGDIRIDVKSSEGRIRAHTFSYDQCNPPQGTQAVVISLFVERIPGGVSINDLRSSIETQISGSEDLVLKLHEIIAWTLGSDLVRSLNVTFDSKLSESSLQMYDLLEIPAIRGGLPARVSNVHFVADLSGDAPLSEELLLNRDPQFWIFIPRSRAE